MVNTMKNSQGVMNLLQRSLKRALQGAALSQFQMSVPLVCLVSLCCSLTIAQLFFELLLWLLYWFL